MKRHEQRELRFDASESETLRMDGSSLCGNRVEGRGPVKGNEEPAAADQATGLSVGLINRVACSEYVYWLRRIGRSGSPT